MDSLGEPGPEAQHSEGRGNVKVITVGKRKGGVYASSCAVNMAVIAAQEGHPVLLLDTNIQQQSCVKWAARRTREDGPEVIGATAAELPAMLKRLASAEGYAIVDTAPHVDSATLEAFRAADLVLAPCGPTLADLETISDVRDLHRNAKSRAKLAVLVTQYASGQKARADELEEGLVAQGIDVCPVRIRRLVAVPDAWALGLGAAEFEPSGEAAADARALWSYAKGALA